MYIYIYINCMTVRDQGLFPISCTNVSVRSAMWFTMHVIRSSNTHINVVFCLIWCVVGVVWKDGVFIYDDCLYLEIYWYKVHCWRYHFVRCLDLSISTLSFSSFSAARMNCWPWLASMIYIFLTFSWKRVRRVGWIVGYKYKCKESSGTKDNSCLKLKLVDVRYILWKDILYSKRL